MILFFLSSGLFLGWSLGANDAANVFGSAVGTKMITFRKAAIIAGIFVVIGAVAQGAGTSHTLNSLGNINAIAGAFTAALTAAITVFIMTKFKLPVSTTQAIVGSIIGWNFYTGNPTDINSLTKIVTTWIAGPIIGAIFSIILYLCVKFVLKKTKPHLLKLDAILRVLLIIVGAFGSYSLGANNIANVMGVFLSAAPKTSLDLVFFELNGVQQLFLIGGIAIAIGIFTYSKRVMERVGNSIVQLSSEAALVVVLAHSLVLFIFSSQSLSNLIVSFGLPPIPMVPVSSSQVIVGAIVGIGFLKGGRGIKFGVVGEISIGWITTPIIAGVFAFFSLFFVNNVFKLEVYKAPLSSVIQIDDNLTQKDSTKTNIVINNSEKNAALIKEEIVKDEINYDSTLIAEKKLNIIGKNAKKDNFWKKLTFFFSVIIVLLLIRIIYSFNNSGVDKNREIVKKSEEISNAQQELIKSELKNLNLKRAHLQNQLEFKNREIVNFALHVIRKNDIFLELKKNIDKIYNEKDIENQRKYIKELLVLVNQNLNSDKDRETLNLHIEEENHDFFNRLYQLNPSLTNNEKRLSALI
ncbi:MAG: inorganic phosphate transporter, partial [Bacteroidales bacterium]|nr:inorganic phosphate transporter [Bacteroidales bacterium]